ncbi:hypothetical protein GCM10008957_12120 [Deinococcus ruber]|uniref:Uncharacterized protein n=1 Tax=Deinococcus ruber TaxID=1848197 RepID=A0A918C0B6_9DEIO|nr:hypothetical protein GCM10008957_12120 [Deinococcus ruber]
MQSGLRERRGLDNNVLRHIELVLVSAIRREHDTENGDQCRQAHNRETEEYGEAYHV